MSGDYYITTYQGRIVSALCKNNQLIQISFCEKEQKELTTGTILLGKVLNKLENIEAVFVELTPGKRGFLPYSEIVGKIPASGELIPVQIIKDAVKTKEPVLSMDLSISGKYSVVHCADKQIRISKKASQKQSKHIREMITDSCNHYPFGIILRTNALQLENTDALVKELNSLSEKMNHIIQYAGSRTAYSVLYRPAPGYIERLQNTYIYDYQRIITDNKDIYPILEAYIRNNTPEDQQKLSFFENHSMSLLNFYKLGEKIEEAFSKNVWLKCGGYLVIEPTESLTAIDVNTGKCIVKKEKEQTVFEVNLEAAKEIARQMRIRNLSGMILIDFINMKEESHNQELLKALRNYVAPDPIQTSVIDMTPLGLVEITRKKINKTLREQYHETGSTE